MTMVVTHASVTGAAANPDVLVDGPKWDANHTLTGAAAPSQGGTGVANNDSSTITISGAYGITWTATATTSLTLPTSGTLATLAGSEALTNKTYNGNTWTAGTGTLTIAAGKTATVSNTLTLAGTDSTTMTFPTTSATIARTDAGQTFTGTNVIGTISIASGALSLTGGVDIQGTNTNDSAAAGYIGEYTASDIALGSAVSLTTSTPANVTSISLTAGDWDVMASVTYNPAATTNTTLAFHSISTTSATQDLSTGGRYLITRFPGGSVQAANFNPGSVGPVRISLSGTTTIYLVAQSTFTVDTMTAYGLLAARRVR